jgi:transcriptional regulator with XRE-family HTH domain
MKEGRRCDLEIGAGQARYDTLYRMRHSPLRDQLREARRQRSWTQAALAARSGTSRVTVARLEAGSGDVRMGTVSRVSEALGLELAAVPRGAEATNEKLLARQQEVARRLERRLAHAELAARLLAADRHEARALIAAAGAAVDRWERERLCSRHYISRWRAMLAGPVERVAGSLLARGGWTDALFQTTPWAFALERRGP